MFKDARTLDRQRTATSFTDEFKRYADHREDWFDGSINSVDRRLARCDKLLHSANSIVGRLDIADSRHYLQTILGLKADREALADLRYALLTGASDREDVIGPPGWRTANDHKPAFPGYHHGQPGNLSWEEERDINNGKGQPWYDKPWGQMTEQDQADRIKWLDAHNNYEPPSLIPPDLIDAMGDAAQYRSHLSAKQKLAGTDARWVTLEAARFVAANADTLDDSHELATRAHHYAQTKTSTFTPQRSAAICEAFVSEVADLGHKAYRPQQTVRTASYEPDFADQAIFLC